MIKPQLPEQNILNVEGYNVQDIVKYAHINCDVKIVRFVDINIDRKIINKVIELTLLN